MDSKDNQTRAPLDLSAFAQNRGWEVSLKTQEDPQDAEIRRKKDLVLFYFALLVMMVFIGVALAFIFGPNATPDDKKWGLAFIASLGSALVGYLVGKKAG